MGRGFRPPPSSFWENGIMDAIDNRLTEFIMSGKPLEEWRGIVATCAARIFARLQAWLLDAYPPDSAVSPDVACAIYLQTCGIVAVVADLINGGTRSRAPHVLLQNCTACRMPPGLLEQVNLHSVRGSVLSDEAVQIHKFTTCPLGLSPDRKAICLVGLLTYAAGAEGNLPVPAATTIRDLLPRAESPN